MPGGLVTHSNFPSALGEPVIYEPGTAGREQAVAEKLHSWREARERARRALGGGHGDARG
jgi:replication-associated recombination protein RarA